MDEKQKLIMEVAQECFNRRGVKYTSIEEIVRACKISKATFYKYFSKKEDLVWEILFYSNKEFLRNSKSIDIDCNINAREKLKKKIIFILDYRNLNTSFNSQIIGEFSEIKGKTIYEIRSKIISNLLQAYYDSLIGVYGKEIDSIVWELIFILDSLVREFNFIFRFRGKEIKGDFAADFMMRIIDVAVENLKGKEPMIDKNTFYENEDINEDILNQIREIELLEKIESIKKTVVEIGDKKLEEAIKRVEEEVKSKSYNSLTMDAMILYLEKEECLKLDINILNDLRIKLQEQNSNGNSK